MVSKCANPDCSNQFRLLRDGSLFVGARVGNAELVQPGNPMGPSKVPRRLEYFWLCNGCSSSLVVSIVGVELTKLKPRGIDETP